MKILELIKNENYIKTIDSLIFFDVDTWMFPDSDGSDIFIGNIIGKVNLPEYKKISKI